MSRVDYMNSGDLTRDWSMAVSYGALAFYPAKAFAVSEQDRATLLQHSRATLDASGTATAPSPSAELNQRTGLFVTIRKKGDLRGCIGTLSPRANVWATVADRTMAAARSALGQRALELPTILVTNQHSLSDAEDFTEGYRVLKLGKVVGEPTSGWIIYTGSQTLVDGSTIRMPTTRITTLEGTTMELNPRPVDIPVSRPIGESLTGKDTQLDTAVRELLRQLGAGKVTTQGAQPF